MAEAFIGGHRVISTGEQAVAGYVWDTNTLSWIASTASSGGGASGNVNVTNTSLPVAQVGTWNVVTGGLTDTQLRAAAVPVSVAGTLTVTGSVSVSNFPATQAISASALPLPTGASTETTLAAVNTKTPALGQALMAASSPVVIASNQSALPVTGTFFQGTQPVSIASMPSTPVTGSFWQTTQPVSGTFWQATQPVSVASMPTTPVTGTFFQATQPVSIAATVTTTDTHTTAAAPISVRLTDGSAFYTATGGGGGGALSTAAKGATAAGSPTSEATDANTQSLHTRIVNTSFPVTGTFWQATQPVSLASTTITGSVAVTGSFFQATQPVSIASMPSTPVTGTFWQATQPVSVAALPALATGANVIGAVTQSGTWNVGSITTLPALPAGANVIGTALQPGSTLTVTGTAATGTALTVTLPAVPALKHYITFIEITAYSTAARTGGATPVVVTTTNLPGTPSYTFATAAAIGTTDRYLVTPATAIVSITANTATTIVCPLTTGVIWRVNVHYYTGA